MEQQLRPLRFQGNRNNPNYPAVFYLLRNYACHLQCGILEIDSGEADVYWDVQNFNTIRTGLVIPGRKTTSVDIEWAWTQNGYPVPKQGCVFTEFETPKSDGIELDKYESFSLSRYNEVVLAEWDLLSFCADILFKRSDYLPEFKHGSREAIYESLPDKNLGLANQPWVDKWMFKLLSFLPRFEPVILTLPTNARLWLTHDLDNLSKWRIRSVTGQIARTPLQLIRGQFKLLRRNYHEIWDRLITGRDPYDTMGKIHKIEGRRKSASFFLANGLDHLFHRYDLSKPRYKRILKECESAGKDIGLHGQVHFISSQSGIQDEVTKMSSLMQRSVLLNRQHYLRWDAYKTFGALEKAGLLVDSTLGYNDTPGFRAGTAWPYLWFDCAKNCGTELLEVPLILAEFQFYNPSQFDGAQVRKVIQDYLEKTCNVGGVFTVLFHNQYFYEKEFSGHSRVYADLIDNCNKKGLMDFEPIQTQAEYVVNRA